mgnify:CR=1 FL=1
MQPAPSGLICSLILALSQDGQGSVERAEQEELQPRRRSLPVHGSGNTRSHVSLDAGAEQCGYTRKRIADWLNCSLDGAVQVYPRAWTAVLVALDNVGMWNLRSEDWARRYQGQQFYLRVYTPSHSFRDELPIPSNALRCGRATNASGRSRTLSRY